MSGGGGDGEEKVGAVVEFSSGHEETILFKSHAKLLQHKQDTKKWSGVGRFDVFLLEDTASKLRRIVAFPSNEVG